MFVSIAGVVHVLYKSICHHKTGATQKFELLQSV